MRKNFRFIELRLDPFYQTFLRAHFQQNEIVFEFPKAHPLVIKLEYLLSKNPPDFKPSPTDPTDNEIFKIAIPNMEYKNADYYNYLSDKSKKHMVLAIKDFYKFIVNEEIIRARNKGIPKLMIVDKIIEDFNLTEFDPERISRAYTRFLKTEYNRRHYLRNKKSNKNQKKLVS